MKDLGPVSRVVGIDVLRDRPNNIITISQGVYILEDLKRYGFEECRGVSTPVEGKVKLLETEKENKSPSTRVNSVGIVEYRSRIARQPRGKRGKFHRIQGYDRFTDVRLNGNETWYRICSESGGVSHGKPNSRRF